MNENFEILKMQVNEPRPKESGGANRSTRRKPPTTSPKIGTTYKLLQMKINHPGHTSNCTKRQFCNGYMIQNIRRTRFESHAHKEKCTEPDETVQY